MHEPWYLVSSQGAILFYIAANPECTVKNIADGMQLTQRTVWGIIGDLQRDSMITFRREGRRHHYTVNLDDESVKFTHPTIKGIPLKTVMSGVVGHFAAKQ